MDQHSYRKNVIFHCLGSQVLDFEHSCRSPHFAYSTISRTCTIRLNNIFKVTWTWTYVQSKIVFHFSSSSGYDEIDHGKKVLRKKFKSTTSSARNYHYSLTDRSLNRFCVVYIYNIPQFSSSRSDFFRLISVKSEIAPLISPVSSLHIYTFHITLHLNITCNVSQCSTNDRPVDGSIGWSSTITSLKKRLLNLAQMTFVTKYLSALRII